MYQQPLNPPPPAPSNSTRIIWICWCLLWVAVWGILAIVFALGVFTIVLSVFMVLLAAISALAILLPVGKPKESTVWPGPARTGVPNGQARPITWDPPPPHDPARPSPEVPDHVDELRNHVTKQQTGRRP